ncbi:MurR/RpiR family transcriptional regulator [Intestinibacter sp.]
MNTTLETLVYNNYENLNDNDKYIWDYILHNKEKCEKISIKELSQNCNVSHTTILRFAQKLGLNGYSELKFYLKLENKKSGNCDEIKMHNFVDDIDRTMDMMMKRDYTDIFNLLDSCDRIYAYGSGEIQKNAIKEFKRIMLTAGKLVNVIEGREETVSILKYITQNDVIFLYSLSGENERFNKFAEDLKDRGVKIISISQVGNNTLSKISDINIQFYTRIMTNMGGDLNIYSDAQYFIVSEFILLKYIEHIKRKE